MKLKVLATWLLLLISSTSLVFCKQENLTIPTSVSQDSLFRFVIQLDYSAIDNNYQNLKPVFEGLIDYVESEQIDSTDYVNFWDGLQVIYFQLGDYENSSKAVHKTIPIAKQLNDSDMLYTAYFDLAVCYQGIENFELYKEYLLKSFDYTQYSYESRAHGFIHLAELAWYTEGIEKADSLVKESISLSKQHQDTFLINYGYSALVDLYVELGNFKKANHYFKQAMKYSSTFDQLDRLTNSMQEGEILLGMGEYKKALPILYRSDSMAIKLGSLKHIVETKEELADYYRIQKNLDSTLHYSERSQLFRDSILRMEVQKNMNDLKVSYDLEKAKLEKEQAIERNTGLERENNLLLALFILIVALTGLVATVLVQRNKKLSLESSLKSKDLKLEQKAKEVELAKNEALQQQLEFKEAQLTSMALNHSEKTKTLSQIIEKMEAKIAGTSQSQELITELKSQIESEEDWKSFKMHFDAVHEGFFSKLLEKSSELTPKDLKYCAYIRMSLNAKEIAQIFAVSHRTIEGIRYRVRKKLGLDTKDDLLTFLMKL